MANGNLLSDIKSRLNLGGSRNASEPEDYDDYDEYDDYADYDDYDEYDDDYKAGSDSYTGGVDPYMDRSQVTTRSSREHTSPRLVSMDDARSSARNIAPSTSARSSRSSSIRSYGRTMVDSSLPPTMTAEGSAAVSAASNRRAGGLNSLFGESRSDKSYTSTQSTSSRRISAGSNSVSSRLSGGHGDDSTIHDSVQLSMPGQRQLQVIRPTRYEDAEAVTEVLKSGDAAIIVFTNTDRETMKRVLDFSFGAASALGAEAECIGQGIFAICRNVGLDDRERADLHAQGIG